MRRPGPESPLSEAARSLRGTARLALLVAAVFLMISFSAAKGWLPPELGPVALPLFFASAAIGVWFGIKAHTRALADREMESGRAMIVAIAAQLGRQDDAALERIRAKGGPAGEAAGMILQGRAEKLRRAGKAGR
jgi:hypothetical protein